MTRLAARSPHLCSLILVTLGFSLQGCASHKLPPKTTPAAQTPAGATAPTQTPASPADKSQASPQTSSPAQTPTTSATPSTTAPASSPTPGATAPGSTSAKPISTTAPTSPSTSPSATNSPLSLKVMTFNIGLLKIMNPYAAPDPKAKPGYGDIVPCVDERAAAIPAILAKYATDNQLDIIGLEEVWLKRDQDSISNALKAAGYTVFVPDYKYPEKGVMDAFFTLLSASKTDDTSQNVSELAMLQMPKVSLLSTGLLLATSSRVKLQNPEFHPFAARGGFEVFAEKGFVTAELDTNDGTPRTDLVLAHFQAMQTDKDGRPTIPSEADAFKIQQDQVQKVIAKKTLPTILFGDTNTGPHYAEKEFARFTTEFGYQDMLDTFAKSHSDQKFISWDQDNPLVKGGELSEEQSSVVDHIMTVGTGWSVTDGGIRLSDSPVTQVDRPSLPKQIPLSDHYAVEVTLQLSK